MNKDELGKLYPIFLTEYNNSWPDLYEKEKRILNDILGQSLRTEHI